MFYNILKEQPLLPSYLTIQITMEGAWKNLYLQTLLDAAENLIEKELVRNLAKEEMKYARSLGKIEASDTIILNTVRIEPLQVSSFLRAGAASGKLLFEKNKLYCDFFSKVEFFYEGSAVSGRYKVQGLFRLKEEEVPIESVDFVFIGPLHWFIYKNRLQFIDGKIASRFMNQVLKGACFLDERKFETLRDEAQENDFSRVPRLRLKDSLEVETKIPDPHPILKLTDRMGSFANLLMDYGQGRIVEYGHNLNFECRNLQSEKDFEKDLFVTAFIYSPRGSSFYYCPLDKVSKSLLFLLECGWTILDSSGRKVMRQKERQLDFEMQHNHIQVRGKYVYENFNASIQDVVGAFNRREHFVNLSDPNYVGLMVDEETDRMALEQMEINQNGVLVQKSSFGILEGFWQDSSSQGSVRELQDFQKFLKADMAHLHFEPSEQFKGVLRPYQQVGVEWLSYLEEFGFGGLLADDMGLGKTVQVLAFLSRMIGKGPILIVVPTTLVFNWKCEIEAFLQQVSVFIHHGASRARCKEELLAYSMIITTYPLLRIDCELFSQISFHIVILDEAQYIKNPDTQTAKAVFALQANSRFSLTGTPIENHLQDLWAQFHFLLPGLLGEKEAFTLKSATSSIHTFYLNQLKAKIKPFFLRRKKQEVAKDLPEKIEQVVWVEMEPLQKEFYEHFLASIRTGLLKKVAVDGIKKHKLEVFEAILRLRQIACHPSLVLDKLGRSDEKMGSGKWNVLLEDIQTVCEEGAKVIVYSQFTAFLKILLKKLREDQRNVLYLDGETKNREEQVKLFQEDSAVQIFLISLKAGGVGLNLTAADYIFLYDPWWNESAEMQAIDRAHRIGRTEKVIAKRYVVQESIEEKIMKLKAYKKELVQKIMDTDFEHQILDEDLLELF